MCSIKSKLPASRWTYGFAIDLFLEGAVQSPSNRRLASWLHILRSVEIGGACPFLPPAARSFSSTARMILKDGSGFSLRIASTPL